MTKVVFYKSQGTYYGFYEQGHTGYADAGEDILCAAISSMTMLVINTLESTYGSEIDYTINENGTEISVKVPSALNDADERVKFASCGLIKAYYNQLLALEADYKAYLQVQVSEQPLQ